MTTPAGAPCPRCQVEYPDESYLAAFFNGQAYEGAICGVCALERLNEIHKTRLTRFHGEAAENKRQMALIHRAALAAKRVSKVGGA